MRDRRENWRSLQKIPVTDHDKDRDKTGRCRKLMAVMALGIRHGQTVTVEVCGADEEEAAEAVRKFFEAKL